MTWFIGPSPDLILKQHISQNKKQSKTTTTFFFKGLPRWQLPDLLRPCSKRCYIFKCLPLLLAICYKFKAKCFAIVCKIPHDMSVLINKIQTNNLVWDNLEWKILILYFSTALNRLKVLFRLIHI